METQTGLKGPTPAKVPGGLGAPQLKARHFRGRRPAAFIVLRAICMGGLQCNCNLIVLELLVQRQSTPGDVNRQEARQTSGLVNN